MRAVRYAAYGGSEVLRIEDVDEPHAGPGEIRVAVRAAGVNGIDWKIRSGAFAGGRPLEAPRGTGTDAAGVVDEVGDGVTGIAVGDAVAGSGRATWAEHAVLTAWALRPPELDEVEAAGYPVPVETAVRILSEVGAQPGRTLLVSGASGGVGTAVLNFARERAIPVIATAGPRSQDHLRALGALPLLYGDGLVERVRALAPDGVDAALDIAGSGVVPELVELTGDPSRVLSIADFSAPEHGARVSSRTGDTAAALREAFALAALGRFALPVARTFTLDEAAEAQDAAQAGHAVGRHVVLL